jgi:hypothetical protein
MLNVVTPSVFMMIVVMLRINILGAVMMSVVVLCDIMLYVIYAESRMLSAFMLIIVTLILDKMGLGVVILSVVMSYVI